MMFEQEFDIEVVKGYQHGGTLHQRCTILKPVSLQQWSAMKEPLQQLEIFRRDLKTYKPMTLYWPQDKRTQSRKQLEI